MELKRMIAEWVRRARTEAGMSGADLGAKLALELGTVRGHTRANISHWETQKHSPNLQQMLAISKVTGKSLPPSILATMRSGDASADPNVIEGDGTLISERIDRARAQAILAGDPSYRPVTVMADDSDDVAIPLVQLRLSAGVTGFEVDQDSESPSGHIKLDRRYVDANHYNPEKLFALRVRGESMEPKLSNGDTVIINTADIKPVDGDVFAVNYEGEAVIKRLVRDAGDWWLASDNPDQRRYYRKICRGPDCIIVGRAVQAITKL